MPTETPIAVDSEARANMTNHRCEKTRRPVGTVLFSVALVVAIAGPPIASARAQDSQSWMRFSSDARADRSERGAASFARDWEQSPPKGFATLGADNIGPTKKAIERYAEIVARGGWRPVPGVILQPGMYHPAVRILRERLRFSGDLKDESTSENYDYYVERAVKRYQASNGLAPTGVVDRRTLAALNVPATARLRQLRTNLTRLTEVARGLPGRYVMVNVPAAQIEAVENGKVVSRHSAVVGKIDRQTPLLRSQVHELNFNPVWHLPPTVIQQDLVPKGRDMARRNQSVLTKYGIDAYGSDGRKLDPMRINWSSESVRGLTFRQQPGPENPLGFVKINFHNSHSVYLHDTPSDSLFGRNFRAASSGCVRVSEVQKLAAWMLGEQGGWSEARVAEMKKSGERLDVRLKRPVPLYMVYVTAWATEDGVVQFRRDLYRKDGVGLTASAY
jgi:murein L,D-transpeptidase YcbB/YkuD